MGVRRSCGTGGQRAIKIEEKTIAEKAMALVSCARYGEFFAERKLVFEPVILLKALLRKQTLNPHSEAQRQWGPLAVLRVVEIEEAGAGMYRVRLLDTPENLQALRLAIQLLSIGEAEYEDEAVEYARQLVIPVVFSNPTRARVNFVRSAEYAETPLNRVHKILSGVSPDLLD